MKTHCSGFVVTCRAASRPAKIHDTVRPPQFGRHSRNARRRSFGENAARLAEAKRRYDPDHLFKSAIPIPALP
jgi:hypothetical protein